MKTCSVVSGILLVVVVCAGRSWGMLSGSAPRAMGMAQAYTAMARGPQSVFWNPANLGLEDNHPFSWQVLAVGGAFAVDNNSWSVRTYNRHFTDSNDRVSPRGTSHYISDKDKRRLLADVPKSGLKLDLSMEPMLALGVPINGGIAFRWPWDLQSALTLGLTSGMQGTVPKDIVELSLFGNDFAWDRRDSGLQEGYDITAWDGSAWVVGSINWAAARSWMPRRLDPYLSEFTVGATLKILGGMYASVVESGGAGLASRVDGVEIDAYLITQRARGRGIGLDFGAAGVTEDGRTTISVSMLNLLDRIKWGRGARQDSFFVIAEGLLLYNLVDPAVTRLADVFDNDDVDGDGNIDFHVQIGSKSFTRDLPPIFRLGVAHEHTPRLSLVGAYDQAFASRFGLTTTPRLATGVEYRLVPWFAVRGGLSAGGRWRRSSAVGMAFGPFPMGSMEINVMDMALVNRGGFFPGLARGTAFSVRFVEAILL